MKLKGYRFFVAFVTCAIGIALSGVWLSKKQNNPSPILSEKSQVIISPTPNYLIKSGDSLDRLAQERYGHRYYSHLIKIHNNIEDAAKIEVGSGLSLPELPVLLEEEGVAKIAKEEMSDIISSRDEFLKVKSQLSAIRSEAGGATLQLPDEVKTALAKSAKDLNRAIKNLSIKKAGIKEIPHSLIGQLQQNLSSLNQIASGDCDVECAYNYDLDVIEQRYAMALTYSVIWARNGFA